jgi:diguanylate cyclase (GGDEF)-like protein
VKQAAQAPAPSEAPGPPAHSADTLPGPGVKAATRMARRAVLAAVAMMVLLVSALLLQRADHQQANSQAMAAIKTALEAAATIALEDERLTLWSHLAVASGELKWIKDYDLHFERINRAIAEASALAPPGAAERFDQSTRLANDRLSELERAAFAHVAAGRLVEARAVLEGKDYAVHKAVLTAGTQAFMTEVQASLDERLRAVAWRSTLQVSALIALALGTFVLLWQRLQRRLQDAEQAFAAKEEEITRLALHDPLTGLPNRRLLALRLEHAIAQARREGGGLALLLVDLDGFKPVNDQHGHAAGDTVLVEVGRRLGALVRAGETVARLGGDEFVVVLGPGNSAETAARVAERLVEHLSRPVALPASEVQVGASVGIALWPADGAGAEELLREADAALYRAKGQARGGLRLASGSVQAV